jgi:hypothetical protein
MFHVPLEAELQPSSPHSFNATPILCFFIAVKCELLQYSTRATILVRRRPVSNHSLQSLVLVTSFCISQLVRNSLFSRALEFSASATSIKANTMDEYQYSSLSCATAIRVLVLQISKDAAEPGDPLLLFSLEDVNLEEHPEYEALSYTWGETTWYNGFTYQWNTDPPRTYPIEIRDSGLLQITTNLKEFLQYLAESAPSGTSIRKIWADQICINQKDIEERNSQVAMMKRIYQTAWRTLIWLGKQDTDTMTVLKLLQAVATPEPKEILSTALLRNVQQRVKELLHSETGMISQYI